MAQVPVVSSGETKEYPDYNSGAEYLYGTAGHYNGSGSDNDSVSETDYNSGVESFYG